MNVLKVFLKFPYDLVIGDCWQMTAAIILVLASGVVLLRLDMIPVTLLVICLGAIIMAVPPLIVVFETRANLRRK